MEHDGFGGMIGSVNIESKYLRCLDSERGNRCVYVLKDKFNREDYYYTEIDRDYILFKKSDLINIIRDALSSPNKTHSATIRGKRVIDNVIWEDILPTGPCAKGPKFIDISINIEIDLSEESPKYKMILEEH